MKFSFYIFIILSISGAFGQSLMVTEIRAYKEVASFPYFKGGKPGVAQKINMFLQLEELQHISAEGKSTILVDYNPKNPGNRGVPSYAFIGYKINSMDEHIVSVSISSEGCGAYCTGQTNNYAFNAQNGEIISLEDFFTDSGYTALSKNICKIFVDSVQATIKWVEQDTTNDLESKQEVLEILYNCIDSGKLFYYVTNFSIEGNKFQFSGSCDFPDVYGAFEPNQWAEFRITEADKWMLSDFGKKVFFDSLADITAFHSNPMNQMFRCRLEDDTYFSFFPGNFWAAQYGYGYIYFEPLGLVCHSSSDTGEPVIIHVFDDKKKMEGDIILTYEDGKVFGSYTFKNSKTILSFTGEPY